MNYLSYSQVPSSLHEPPIARCMNVRGAAAHVIADWQRHVQLFSAKAVIVGNATLRRLLDVELQVNQAARDNSARRSAVEHVFPPYVPVEMPQEVEVVRWIARREYRAKRQPNISMVQEIVRPAGHHGVRLH